MVGLHIFTMLMIILASVPLVSAAIITLLTISFISRCEIESIEGFDDVK